MFVTNSRTTYSLDMNHLASQAEELSLSEPKPDIYGRFQTLNKFGFMFGMFDQVATDFLTEISQNRNRDSRVLEIGCAYGNVAIEALRRGCQNYIANDLSLDHLRVVASKALSENSACMINKLELINSKFPTDFDLPENYIKFGLINKVLHFLNPLEIEQAMKKISNITMKNGKWFVLTVSPKCKDFLKFEQIYNNRKKIGIVYPGYCRDAKKFSTDNMTTSQLPESMMFMDVDDLSKYFINAGFKILKTYSLNSPSNDNMGWTQGEDMVGVIAQKL